MIQPNGWSCLPTAFAIVLQVEVGLIFDFVQHTGSEVLWPDLESPYCRRSFHIQEMKNYCLHIGYSCTTVTPKLGLAPRGTPNAAIFANQMFDHCTRYYNGVFTGTIPGGLPHALAYRGNKTIDPSTGEPFQGEMIFDQFHIIQQTC